MAIAADSSSSSGGISGGSNSLTYSFTNTAGDLLVVGVFNVTSDGTPTATWNGTSMTEAGHYQIGTSSRQVTLFYLKNAATGTHNVVVSQTGTTFIYSTAASYSGTNTTTQPDSSATAKNAGSSNSLTATTTVVGSNCWLVCASSGDNGDNGAGGTGTTQRSTAGVDHYVTIMDSNGTVGTGSQSLVTNYSPSQSIGTVIISVAPASASGPVNVKEWNGLAKASVKAIDGLAIASIKTLNGLN